MKGVLAALWGFKLGANDLPYGAPLHPNFVHLTLGLFIIAILFDIAGTLWLMCKICAGED